MSDSAIQNEVQAPILVGGSCEIACSLAGRLLDQFEGIYCGPPTGLLCHPSLWQSDDIPDWGVEADEFLFASQGASLWKSFPGSAPSLPGIEAHHFCEAEVRQLLRGSANYPEFLGRFFEPRLTTSTSRHWAECAPENLYAVAPFLESYPEGKAILIVEDGRTFIAEQIRQGVSPKAAAKIWTLETSIVVDLSLTAELEDRVCLIRVEDLVYQPDIEIARMKTFVLGENAESSQPGGDSKQFEPGTLELRRWFKEIEQRLRNWDARGSDSFIQYALGCYPKSSAIELRAGTGDVPLGADLFERLGYGQIPPRKQINLSKEEQSLSTLKAKWINPLVEYRKPAKAAEKPKAKEEKPRELRPLEWLFGLFRQRQSSIKNVAATAEEPPEPAGESASQSLMGDRPVRIPSKPSETEKLESLPILSESDFHYDLGVVIAFLGRHRMIELTVRELARARKSGISVAISLVCSNEEDYRVASDLKRDWDGISVKPFPNRPLGAKWQAGIDDIRQYSPDNIAIVGSDDVVAARYFCRAIEILKKDKPDGGIDFVAPSSWFVFDAASLSDLRGSLWELAYHPDRQLALGAGRVYSHRILDRFDWDLYKSDRESGLDVYGFQQVKEHGGSSYFIPAADGVVLSIKGDWGALNPTAKLLSAESIQAVARDFCHERFFEENFSFSEPELLDHFSESGNGLAEESAG